MTYQVVIVEDNAMVAMLNRRNIQKDPRFQVVRECHDGFGAFEYLSTHPVDLVILDVYMPLLNGVELLRQLRSYGIHTDVIMVTAANDTKTFDQLLKLGVIDYLVKPFTAQRFQQALDKFCQHRQTVSSQNAVRQSDIDRLFSMTPLPDSSIPKGLQAKTLERICEELSSFPDTGVTSEQIAQKIGLSTVTVRRYLNYLVDSGQVESRLNYDTGGRPCILFFPNV